MNIPDISVFPKGSENESFAQYFIGQSYLNMLSTEQVVIGGENCRTEWCETVSDEEYNKLK